MTKAMTGFTTQNCSVAWEWGRGVRGEGSGGAVLWAARVVRVAGSPTYLLAEAQEPDGVGRAPKAAGAIEAAGPGYARP